MKFLFAITLLALFATFVSARPGKISKQKTKSVKPLDDSLSDSNVEQSQPDTPPVEKPNDIVASHQSREKVLGDEELKSRRKNIVHEKPYNDADLSVELFRETLSRHLGRSNSKTDPCHYMRCGPGQECEVNDSGAKCVCRRHCKQRNNPLCGTDEEYYDNHCEMHRASCLSGRDIYDARHKDCFYKASECTRWDLKQYQDILLQYYKNLMTSSNLRPKEVQENQDEEKELSRRKRRVDPPRKHHERKKNRQDQLDILPDDSEVYSVDGAKIDSNLEKKLDVSREKNEPSLVEDETNVNDVKSHVEKPKSFNIQDAVRELEEDEEVEIMTRDSAGDMVKYIFTLMDLDSNKKVGSDEIWEITSLQHLDQVLPGPCSLFHLLKYGDVNYDRTLDVAETFKLFNITVFRLRKNERYVRRPAVYGSPAELECGIEGEPNPIWHRYGLEVEEKNGARVENQILHLSDVTARNGGNYTCSARLRPNMIQTLGVEVLIAPKVQVHPRSQHPVIESSSTLKCHVEGRPDPSIKWNRNGEPLDMKSGRYILMANNTELHFNSVGQRDGAAYSCIAENSAGVGEDVGAIYVQDENDNDGGSDSPSAYFVFHRDGISVVSPRDCQTLRTIHNTEKVPRLLVQDKLCGLNDNEERECFWSESISVGSRYIFAAQPTEDRVVVVDKELQRIAEIITTDLMPVQLFYVPSTDQVFVLCWVDEYRNSSVLQVIHSAGVNGIHSAEHIRPVTDRRHRLYDRSVYDMFIPPECPLNPSSPYGYVIHKGEPTIHRLDFSTLSYGKTIDFSKYQCSPVQMNYLPIGGLLHVTCLSDVGVALNLITVDIETDTVIDVQEENGMLKEYFSNDYNYVIRLYPRQDMITIHNISQSGKLHEFMAIRTNFAVADVYFVEKKYKPNAMVAYMLAKNQGDVMYVDLDKKKVEIIDSMTPPVVGGTWPWTDHTRKLASSDWFGWFLATAGRTGMEIIGLNTNQVLCRMNNFVHVTTISWSHGEF